MGRILIAKISKIAVALFKVMLKGVNELELPV
jgi:hypothetical protein